MIGEQNYYQAKVFLSSYRDALNTLDEVARNRALLDKCHAYERYLVNGANNAEIFIEGNQVSEGSYFKQSKIRRLGMFSKGLFSDKLGSFDSAKTFEEVKKSLEVYL